MNSEQTPYTSNASSSDHANRNHSAGTSQEEITNHEESNSQEASTCTDCSASSCHTERTSISENNGFDDIHKRRASTSTNSSASTSRSASSCRTESTNLSENINTSHNSSISNNCNECTSINESFCCTERTGLSKSTYQNLSTNSSPSTVGGSSASDSPSTKCRNPTLFVDAFLQNNRLDHVSQVMGYHKTYLDHFFKTQNFILRGDGPLPYDHRHYIAIMAAGRHQCSYLITLQKQEFLLQRGDPEWLKGLDHIPTKLRNLNDINKILAHRPWLLNKSHIEKLTKGKDSWSLAEVVHAIVILAHFHSLSSFVFSCGLNQELDQLALSGYQFASDNTITTAKTNNNSKTKPKDIPIVEAATVPEWKSPSNTPPSPTEPEVGINTLMQRMKTLSEQQQECKPEELAKRFDVLETQSAEIGAVASQPLERSADIGCYVEDASFMYIDFAKRGDSQDITTFRVQDYSWDDHGYSLVNRLYNDVGNLLDDKFRTAYNLTYYTMGTRTDVDTTRFRRAIWYYIQCLFGIRHDDYDYGEINALLERTLKTFIKSATCYPDRVTKKDYDRVLREFHYSEKVHVNLMVLESRMQAELLYALRTVNRYMTN